MTKIGTVFSRKVFPMNGLYVGLRVELTDGGFGRIIDCEPSGDVRIYIMGHENANWTNRTFSFSPGAIAQIFP